jgi:spore maturation protein CgeB
MNPLSILYIGRDSGTSRHRMLALERLGHSVVLVDPEVFLPNSKLSDAWTWRTGALFLEGYLRRQVLASIPRRRFDLAYVDHGELVGPSLAQELKDRFGTVVNYNVDDPYGRRDGPRWRLYLSAVPVYDLIVVVRDCNVEEAYRAGAARVLRVHRSADEILHSPKPLSEADYTKWSSDVAFVGTWMPERGPFLARLAESGVPLSIYGDRWHKAREYPLLRSFWRGPGLYDDCYAKVIQSAKISLGLLSKGNRDLVTTRSFEIPALGGVLCAERTSEHVGLYLENEEAVFWDTPEECAQRCMQLLKDKEWRERLGLNGRNRCLHNNTTNEKVMAQILHEALSVDQTTKTEAFAAHAGADFGQSNSEMRSSFRS